MKTIIQGKKNERLKGREGLGLGRQKGGRLPGQASSPQHSRPVRLREMGRKGA